MGEARCSAYLQWPFHKSRAIPRPVCGGVVSAQWCILGSRRLRTVSRGGASRYCGSLPLPRPRRVAKLSQTSSRRFHCLPFFSPCAEVFCSAPVFSSAARPGAPSGTNCATHYNTGRDGSPGGRRLAKRPLHCWLPHCARMGRTLFPGKLLLARSVPAARAMRTADDDAGNREGAAEKGARVCLF